MVIVGKNVGLFIGPLLEIQVSISLKACQAVRTRPRFPSQRLLRVAIRTLPELVFPRRWLVLKHLVSSSSQNSLLVGGEY
jgi:hypothetical protein